MHPALSTSTDRVTTAMQHAMCSVEWKCCKRRGERSRQSILPQWENFQEEEEVNTSPLERKTKQNIGVPEPPERLSWDNAFFCLRLCRRSAL